MKENNRYSVMLKKVVYRLEILWQT